MIKNSKKYYGTGVALITPFNYNNTVDFKSLEKLILHVINGNINYLVVLGTTSEYINLNYKEKNDIINCIKKVNNKKIPIILGCGGNSTKNVINELLKIDLSDIDAILSVSPYYNRPSQKGIYQHFKEISNNINQDIILYNVPSRTGSNILPNTVLQLADDCKNIIGIKESSGNLIQVYEIIKNKNKDFHVISGDDLMSLPIILGGGSGVISVLAQAIPKDYSYMIHLAMNNKVNEAYNIYYKIYDMMNLIFEEGNPTGIKTLLNIIGICNQFVRLPLIQGSKNLYNQILNTYKKYL